MSDFFQSWDNCVMQVLTPFLWMKKQTQMEKRGQGYVYI